MSNESVFSFELNESLYFEKGQEVAEMTGIALDPEISIQPFNDYVSIRGVIELHGEYKKSQVDQDDEDENVDFDVFQSKRYIDKVINKENEEAEFSHRFPVEISVPTYRVKDLNDVSVSVDYFDYEIPKPNQLKLKSTIDIYGIADHKKEDRVDGMEEEAENVFPKAAEDTFFQFEIKDARIEEENDPESHESVDIPAEPHESDDEKLKKDRWKHTKSQTFAEFFKKEALESSSSDKMEELPVHEVEFPSPSPSFSEASDSPDFYENSGSQPYIYESVESREEEPVIAEVEGEVSRESEEQPQDVRYLTDMFMDDMEYFTQMRLYIVQNQDTIETIADRYQISPNQLLKQNRLADEAVLAGQLLYIPYTKKR